MSSNEELPPWDWTLALTKCAIWLFVTFNVAILIWLELASRAERMP